MAAADEAVSAGRLEEAGANLARIEEVLEHVHPFGAKARPEGWRSLLLQWISGESVVSADRDASDFVQDGLVYRLVWAVEAIRAHADAVGIGEQDASAGRASMALTYGVPTVAAALLLRYGLPSRRLAMDVVRRVPPPEDAVEVDADLSEWMDSVFEFEPSDLFIDPLDLSLWTEFTSPATVRVRRWSRSWLEVDVAWIDQTPPPGTRVRMVSVGGITHVCALDLTTLGSSIEPITHVVRAVVRADGRLDAERFGPAS